MDSTIELEEDDYWDSIRTQKRQEPPRKEISGLLGQKMLQGWTLLAESCPSIECFNPLVERKKDHTILCVNCEKNFNRETISGEMVFLPVTAPAPAPVPVASTLQPTPAPTPQPSTTSSSVPQSSTPSTNTEDNAIQQRLQHSRNSSSLISKKLLEGWSMLQESCPVCQVPLMRNREGEMTCVVCNMRVIKQSEFDPTKYRVAEGQTAPQVYSAPRPATATQPAHEEPASKRQEVEERREIQPEPVSFQSKERKGETRGDGREAELDSAEVLERAVDQVYLEIKKATENLQSGRDKKESLDILSSSAVALAALLRVPQH
ncbi:hypothetical protein PROFUN_03014 [Planoprotostelium fungivorum]|uniref:Uncharacterized protein n=1 Tax=Planoprotostelium fungivorum TaxID=1890364 RepID=A0A2P6NXB6_9EUKA|nr:hypothetical protein PROFUN_03014 [Planoprotostelium fungivorum]